MFRPDRRSALAAVLLLCALAGEAQPWAIGLRGHFGFLWPHRPSSWILVEDHCTAPELFLERRLPGERPWQ
ncbi:MAG TPA: hypothetical protein PLH93_05085, partial [Flavobacteriales bacterium]|nr:hypothetical protein [Flavobacteriales bacterium]